MVKREVFGHEGKGRSLGVFREKAEQVLLEEKSEFASHMHKREILVWTLI
jgi:hypothetical protein